MGIKKFFTRLGDNTVYRKLMKEPLTYVAGAILLSVFQIANLAVLGSGWGITSAFTHWGAWILQSFGIEVVNWDYFATEKAKHTLEAGFLADGGSLQNAGVILGAMIAALFASQFKIRRLKTVRQPVAAILGGLLMGYGARLAMGCNVGALFTGIASLSLSGWVFAVFLMAGAWIGGKLLTKYFM